jgi:histidinol-phosphatase (PHP family)
MKTNYHTHTTRCKHAEGSDEAYVLAAIKAGYSTLGFADHAPWPKHPLETQRIRMEMDEYADYVASIRRLSRQYGGKIEILLGLEAEYYPDRMEYLKALKENTPLDYLILGNHFHLYEAPGHYYGRYSDPQALYQAYEESSIAALKSGLFEIFAHPDLFVRSLEEFDQDAKAMSRRILKVAKEENVLIEFNLGGVRSGRDGMEYPYLPFWQLVKEVGNTVIIGIDAHSPSDLSHQASIEYAKKTLRSLGIVPVESIK